MVDVWISRNLRHVSRLISEKFHTLWISSKTSALGSPTPLVQLPGQRMLRRRWSWSIRRPYSGSSIGFPFPTFRAGPRAVDKHITYYGRTYTSYEGEEITEEVIAKVLEEIPICAMLHTILKKDMIILQESRENFVEEYIKDMPCRWFQCFFNN